MGVLWTEKQPDLKQETETMPTRPKRHRGKHGPSFGTLPATSFLLGSGMEES